MKILELLGWVKYYQQERIANFLEEAERSAMNRCCDSDLGFFCSELYKWVKRNYLGIDQPKVLKSSKDAKEMLSRVELITRKYPDLHEGVRNLQKDFELWG